MRTRHALLAVATVVSATTASAFEFHGYFRDPLGFNSKGGGQVCFQLPGAEFKARLGNECDHYWELVFDQTVYKDATGLEAKVEFMPAYGLLATQPTGKPGYGYGTGSVFTAQAWASIAVPGLRGSTFWAGQRYYRRHNVESDDWFYWNPFQGYSAVGVEEIDVVIGKLAVVFGRGESIGTQANPADVLAGTYLTPEIRIYEIPTNTNGTLEVGLNGAVAISHGGALGPDRRSVSPWVTVEHEQQKLLGGFNRLSFQYANGAAATMQATPLSGATSGPRQWRVIEQLMFFPIQEVSGQLVLVYQDQTNLLGGQAAPGSGARIYTAQIRPAYHFTDWFKLQTDLFLQVLDEKGSSAGTPQLAKVTVAPTLVAGRGFLARPEIRLFATWGFWNAAAAALGDRLGTPIASGVFGSDRSGLVVGAHVEAWW
jgi:maltoporin